MNQGNATYQPLVTVAIAVYNNADNIDRMLKCIDNQTLRDIEILCIDDASTDNSVDIVNLHAQADGRYRVIVKDKNAGLSDTRNISLAEAKGKYIYFCDADDVCSADMLEKAVAKAETDNADMVIWDYYEFGEAFYRLVDKDTPSELSVKASVKEMVRWGAFMWTHLFRTASIRGLGLPFPLGRTKQDLPIHWASCIAFGKISVIPERLYGYRISSGQTSRKKGRVLLDFIFVHDYLKEHLLRTGQFEAYKEEFYKTQAVALCLVCQSIDEKYLTEAKEMARERICDDLTAAIKNENLQLRLGISAIQGNRLAGWILKSHFGIKNFLKSILK